MPQCQSAPLDATSLVDLPAACLVMIMIQLEPGVGAASFPAACHTTRAALSNNSPMWSAWLLRHRRYSALHAAAKGDRAEVLGSLLASPHAPHVNATWGPMCLTPLHVACKHGSSAAAQVLLEAAVQGVDRVARIRDGATPLHLACQRPNNLAVLKLLLRHADVDVNATDDLRLTPLHLAAWLTNDPFMVRHLLSAPGT